MPSTIAASIHLSLAAQLGLQQGGEDADHQVRRPTTEVADEVGREVGALRVLAHHVQRAGDRDVVHVVTGRLGQRPVLPPAGHPAVDDPLVDLPAVLGPEPEPLGHTGAHALHHDVGLGDQVEHHLRGLGVLEVERDARPAAVEQHARPAGEHLPARPLDPDHVGAEVGQDHAGMRPGPDARDLDHLHAPQRYGALAQFVAHAGDCDRSAVTVAAG